MNFYYYSFEMEWEAGGSQFNRGSSGTSASHHGGEDHGGEDHSGEDHSGEDQSASGPDEGEGTTGEVSTWYGKSAPKPPEGNN